MRTRANYCSLTASWKANQNLYGVEEGTPQRKIILLDPERFPLYIGNKIYKQYGRDYQKDVPVRQPAAPANASRVRCVSAAILVLYYMATAPLLSLLSGYLNDCWYKGKDPNTTGLFPLVSLCSKKDAGWINGHDAIHSKVRKEVIFYNYALAVPAFASTMFLGSYSDVMGRRPILLVAFGGSLVKLILFAAVVKLSLNTNVLFAAFGVDGLTGSSFVVSIAFFSMAADVHAERTSRVLWIAFLTGLRFLTVSIVTFTVIEYLHPALGTLVTSGLLIVPLLAAILLTKFLLPETFPKSIDGSMSPWDRLCRVFKIYTSEGTFSKHVALFVALIILSLLEVNVLGPRCIDPLYLANVPFCWDYKETRIYSASRLAGQSVVAVIFLKVVYSCNSLSEEKLAIAGTLFQGTSFLLEALAFSSWMIYIVPIIGFPGFVSVPIVETTMSFLVSRNDQGALFAGIAAKEALSTVVAYSSLDAVYTQTAGVTRGAIYLVLASLSVLAFLLFFVFYYLYHKVSRDELTMSGTYNDTEQEIT